MFNHPEDKSEHKIASLKLLTLVSRQIPCLERELLPLSFTHHSDYVFLTIPFLVSDLELLQPVSLVIRLSLGFTSQCLVLEFLTAI